MSETLEEMGIKGNQMIFDKFIDDEKIITGMTEETKTQIKEKYNQYLKKNMRKFLNV